MTEGPKPSRRKFLKLAGGVVVVAAAAAAGAYELGKPAAPPQQMPNATSPVTSAASSASTLPSKDTILVGYSIQFTGGDAPPASAQVQSYQQWVDVINAKGGIFLKDYGKSLPLKAITYDNKSDPSVCVEQVERLITQDNIDLLLPPWGTYMHYAIIPVSQKYGMPYVGNTADTDEVWNIQNPYYFQPYTHYNEANSVVQLLAANANTIAPGRSIKVAVPYTESMGPVEIATDFVKLAAQSSTNFDIVYNQSYPTSITDATTMLVSMKQAQPDALVAGTYPPDSFLMIQQMMEQRFNPGFIYNWVGPNAAGFIEKFGKAAEGICTLGGPGASPLDPNMKPLWDDFVQRFGTQPPIEFQLHQVSLSILEAAVASAGNVNPADIRKALLNETFTTIAGQVAFHGRAYPWEPQYQPDGVDQWQNGVPQIVWGIATGAKAATAPFVYPKAAWPST